MKSLLKILVGACIGFLLILNRQILVIPLNEFNIMYDLQTYVTMIGNASFFFYCIYVMYKTDDRKLNKIKVGFLCLLDVFLLIGNSFTMTSDLSYIYGGIANILYTILFLTLNYIILKRTLILIEDVVNNYDTKINKNFFLKLFDNHPFIVSFIVIMLSFVAYMIAFYPIMMSLDPSFQVKQFFNVRNKYDDYVVLLDNNVLLTNHHPVVHTLLLGNCIKLGRFLLDDNFGLFIYSLIQSIFLASTLAYTIKYLKDNKCSLKTLVILLLIYVFVPMFGMYAMSAVKDTIYTCFVIWYVLFIDKFIKNKKESISNKNIILFIVIILGVILFRNNGIYVVLFSLPFVVFYCKKSMKKLLLVLLITLSFNTLFNKVILPYYKITPGSVRETLSIPFQQTARYVKYYGDELSSKDKKAISKVLNYKNIAKRYNPKLADPVKNDYNKYATSSDLKNYFKVWGKGLIKHPGVYVEATLNNVYGYFTPQDTNWYVYYKYYDIITEDDLVDYYYNDLEEYRMVLGGYSHAFPYIPIVGMLSNIGFNTWILLGLAVYSIYKKKKEYLITLSPLLISLLICVASPANTYFRYTMPYVFILPSLFMLFAKRFKSVK